MYQSECTPKQVRGVIISMYQLFITLGILVASCINLGTKRLTSSCSWRITIGTGIIWPLILAVGVQFLDESPRWDMHKDRTENAHTTLSKLYNSEAQVRIELDEIRASVRAERFQEKITFKGFWTEPTIVRRFAVGVVLQMMQQLTGINYFFYFGTKLFANLHVGDSYVTAVILGAVNFVSTFVGLWVARRFGHRSALFFGGLWIGTWLMVSLFAHLHIALANHYAIALCLLRPLLRGSEMPNQPGCRW
jgi:SP family sugar:H+ symporter-like MFS transporter